MDEKKIALGEKYVSLEADSLPVHYVDFLLEARHHAGVVALAFASSVVDTNNEPEMRPVARLRMNLLTAQTLHNLLGDMIKDALKPADTSRAN